MLNKSILITCSFAILVLSLIYNDRIHFSIFWPYQSDQWIIRLSSTDAAKMIRPSSAYCTLIIDRNVYCHFETLCYRFESNEYFLLIDPNRTILPENFNQNHPVYGRLSSVYDHNRYLIKYLPTVPYDQLDKLISDEEDGPKFYWLPKQTMIFSRFKPDNLLHLIHDDLLPLQATISAVNQQIDNVFIDDDYSPEFGQFFIEQVAKTKRLLFRGDFSVNDSIVCFERAYLGLTTSTIWYQYGFRRPQSPIERNENEYRTIRIQIERMRHKIHRGLNLPRKQCADQSIVVIARKHNRKILNLNDFLNFMRQKYSNYSVNVIEIERSMLFDIEEFKKIIRKIRCASKLFAMHGSELILSIFIEPLRDQIEIYELFPYGINGNHSSIYKVLVQRILRYKYFSWTNTQYVNTQFPSDQEMKKYMNYNLMAFDNQKFEAINSINKSMDELGEMLCCANHHWLFRINQNTKVDLSSFDEFLEQKQSMITDRDEFESEQQRQFLGQIHDIQCTIIGDQVKISWQEPWNLKFISMKSPCFQYEIVIQIDSQSNGPPKQYYFHTNNTWLLINNSSINSSNHDQCLTIWVKMKCDIQIQSEYNRIPADCCPASE